MAIHRNGGIYNIKVLRTLLLRDWEWEQSLVDEIVDDYWQRLNHIDQRSNVQGLHRKQVAQFVPLADLLDKLDAIAEVTIAPAARIREAAEERGRAV